MSKVPLYMATVLVVIQVLSLVKFRGASLSRNRSTLYAPGRNAQTSPPRDDVGATILYRAECIVHDIIGNQS